MSCKVRFLLKSQLDLGTDEVFGIVGNVEELGSWDYEKAILLKPSSQREGFWEVSISVLPGTELSYRYFHGIYHSSKISSEKKLLVKTWEININTRTYVVPGHNDGKVDEAEFGVIDGMKSVDTGWLMHQHQLRFHISSPKNFPFLQFTESYAEKFKPDLSTLTVQPEASTSAISSKLTIIKPYQFTEYVDKSEYKADMPQCGDLHVTFTVETLDWRNLFIKLIIHADDERVGVGVINADQLTTSKGILKLPLLDDNFSVIGSLRVPYLHVKPMPASLSMEKCFTKYWKQRPMVHVGHRGSGNSYTSEKIASVCENTLASFQHASKHGANYIEFDVHLTKDQVPIVYHDLTTCISVAKRGAEMEMRLLEVPVSSLTLNQLQSFKVTHRSRQESSKTLAFDDNDLSPLNRMFPTLREVFEGVAMETGFNIEVKWPTLDENNEYEDGLEHYYDANEFVDLILQVVFDHSQSRKVVFSCFDVDICIMLRRKQNRYPVLFLTNGDTLFYTPMLDVREAVNRMAIGTAKAEGLIGINTLDKDVHRTPDIVKKTHEAGLLFACYGDDVTNNLQTIETSSVDMAIYDRIYEKQQSQT